MNFTLVLYILHYFLYNKAIISKFSYKMIDFIYILDNTYIKLILLRFLKKFLSLILLNYLFILLFIL